MDRLLIFLYSFIVLLAGWDFRLDAEVIADWKFNEGKGTILKDNSGRENEGIIHGAAWTEGKFASGLYFKGIGSNNYVEVPGSESLQLINSFTIEFWHKKVSNDTQVFFRKGLNDSHLNYYACFLPEDGGKIHFQVVDKDKGMYEVTASITKDGWHHLAFVYDGEYLKIYIDKKLSGSEKTGKIHPSVDESPLYIGTYNPGYSYCLNGILDEFKIHNEALTSESLASPEKYEIFDDFISPPLNPAWRIRTAGKGGWFFGPRTGQLSLISKGVPDGVILYYTRKIEGDATFEVKLDTRGIKTESDIGFIVEPISPTLTPVYLTRHVASIVLHRNSWVFAKKGTASASGKYASGWRTFKLEYKDGKISVLIDNDYVVRQAEKDCAGPIYFMIACDPYTNYYYGNLVIDYVKITHY